VSAHFHFAENALALHLLLESAKRLINVVVADEYLHGRSCQSGCNNGGLANTIRLCSDTAANWSG
jgi:hypothetical protein